MMKLYCFDYSPYVGKVQMVLDLSRSSSGGVAGCKIRRS